MSYAGFRFTGRFAADERPEDRPPATEGEAWARDKIAGAGGTEVDATWLNRIKANLENLVARLSGNLNDGDHQLANAIGNAVENKADADHDHDTFYYRRLEIDAVISALQAQISGLGDVHVVDDLAGAATLAGLSRDDVVHVLDNGSGKWARYQLTAAGDGTWAGCTKVLIWTQDQAPASHGHLAADITDSGAAGRSLLTSVSFAAVRALLGIAKLWTRGGDVPSAAVLNLDAATGDYVTVTGATTVTGITLVDGLEQKVRFAGALNLTHGPSLILPTGGTIATEPGDVATFRGEAAGVVRCVGYLRASGTALVSNSAYASEAEAKAGVNATKQMNPLLTRQAIHALGGWATQPLGVPIPVQTSLFASVGASLPPTDQGYRYVLLTAGEDGVGEYNEGILTSESVTGSAPLVQATAVVNVPSSPFHGKIIRLINTERRGLRAGSAGTVEDDQMQQITGKMGTFLYRTNAGEGAFAGPHEVVTEPASYGSTSSNLTSRFAFDSAKSPGARAGTETRNKNIGVNFVMRVL